MSREALAFSSIGYLVNTGIASAAHVGSPQNAASSPVPIHS